MSVIDQIDNIDVPIPASQTVDEKDREKARKEFVDNKEQLLREYMDAMRKTGAVLKKHETNGEKVTKTKLLFSATKHNFFLNFLPEDSSMPTAQIDLTNITVISRGKQTGSFKASKTAQNVPPTHCFTLLDGPTKTPYNLECASADECARFLYFLIESMKKMGSLVGFSCRIVDFQGKMALIKVPKPSSSTAFRPYAISSSVPISSSSSFSSSSFPSSSSQYNSFSSSLPSIFSPSSSQFYQFSSPSSGARLLSASSASSREKHEEESSHSSGWVRCVIILLIVMAGIAFLVKNYHGFAL
eukprot:TRINITY_DN11853_c0_g1_i1.p1 TRINITY_DN11853_c0_g1~~TRINITY_DN11853_c0_g1_i1.p1  ORF type:complete len:300 (-),score=89.30 TRINITY_DN11853_c0_g1_i1:237-1136(-)